MVRADGSARDGSESFGASFETHVFTLPSTPLHSPNNQAAPKKKKAAPKKKKAPKKKVRMPAIFRDVCDELFAVLIDHDV